MNPALLQRVRAAHGRLVNALVGELGPAGHWTGELSTSALSTATAVIALQTVDPRAHADPVRRGLEWLADHANADGGWGDTVRSRSNLSTTALAWAAFGAAGTDVVFPTAVARAEAYIRAEAGSLEGLVPTIEARYGKDRTFSVPITMTLALSGRLGIDGWQKVRPLPFELAALPRGLFGALRLPVVSYALPALIAIGQVIHHRSGRFHPLRDWVRGLTLDRLIRLQPENGGFLEAVPLTSFVTMSLAGMGRADHLVARRGVEFLRASMRPDGSWPIDTNLATWVTTLSIRALCHAPTALGAERRRGLCEWLLGQQGQGVHPYTGAAPGGWAWTDLPGGVPDADDTAGALLALRRLEPGVEPDRVLHAAAAGVEWLLGLQNADGGIPTFCRGWGTLPFDRSTPELTAHALRAWGAWRARLGPALGRRVDAAQARAVRYLASCQRADGAWLPLWFGHEATPDQANPVYGTAQVLLALEALSEAGSGPLSRSRERAAAFLAGAGAGAGDGGWGGGPGVPASVEETSLAVEALAAFPGHAAACERGLERLLELLPADGLPGASPIGLYFARLWYFERLYPLIFATRALGRFAASDEG